ncbi:O-methyltransferase [Saccharothrix yanglingensis]|uniref:Methyltransferase n=1 Tax=Saccharothrix yanglingensis TaxID=659496 RepID=A0ABU0WVV9_9PSEU|nr:O-methyltransferase [Saccharothrix yanglingensis]MDQ2583517.1 methyltransferase [Saccharothrix yanglingensis]
MGEQTWNAVDDYLESLSAAPDRALEDAARANVGFELPDIAVSSAQGRFLNLLARTRGARTVLEIGTFGGYSTIWLARALPADGTLVTIEYEESFARAAGEHIANAGVADRVRQRVGRALDVLPELTADPAAPFDLVFVDANKPDIPEYFEWALKLTRPGSLIVVDNVVQGGAVADPEHPDRGVQGVRRFLERLAHEPRVEATTLQTVGAKGHDGFTLVLVTG